MYEHRRGTFLLLLTLRPYFGQDSYVDKTGEPRPIFKLRLRDESLSMVEAVFFSRMAERLADKSDLEVGGLVRLTK